MNLSNNIIKFYDTIDTLKVSGDSIKVQREKISNVIANFNKKIEMIISNIKIDIMTLK